MILQVFFSRQKDKALMHINDGDEDTSESYLEYQRKARRGEGEKGQGGAGEEQAAKRSALQRGYT